MKALGWVAGIGLSLGIVFLVLAYRNAGDNFGFVNQLMSGRPLWTSSRADEDRMAINLDKLKALDKLKDRLRDIPRPPLPPGHGDSNYTLQDGKLTFDGGWPNRTLDMDMQNISVREIEITGNSIVTLRHLSADKMTITVSDAARLTADGHVGDMQLNISDAGRAYLANLSAGTIKAELTDAASAEIAPADHADVTVHDMSRARLETRPKTLTSDVTDFGKLTGPGAQGDDDSH
jgi:hypothetical protein